MEEGQERRHLCKRCGMSFSNGRVLGGHMKGHTAKVAKEKLRVRGSDAADEEEELGHVLRDIPIESWKCSDLVAESISPTPDARLDFECKICRKGFASIKGLFGHMRLHPRKEKELVKKRKKKDGLESDHGEEHHRSYDLYHCPVRGKRSIRVHYDVVSDSEMEEENVKEVAFCLVLLSRGVRNREGYHSFDKMVENESASASASAGGGDNLSYKRGMEESVEKRDSDDGKNAKSAESSSFSTSSGIQVNQKQKKVKKIDQSCSVGSSSYKHKCSICSKEFMSARALGGHKRSHTMKNTALILQAAANNVAVM